MAQDGTGLTVLHNSGTFLGDGSHPDGSLTVSGSTLYGMASGSSGGRVIFRVGTDGSGYTLLHTLEYGSLGSLLVSGSTLYGVNTITVGPYFNGSVFRMQTDGTGYAAMHYFGSTV